MTVSRDMPDQLLTIALSRFTLRLSTARASMEMALSSSVLFTPLNVRTEMGKAPWIRTIAASEIMSTRRKDTFRFPFAAFLPVLVPALVPAPTPETMFLRSLCTSCYSVPSAAAWSCWQKEAYHCSNAASPTYGSSASVRDWPAAIAV